MNETIYDNSPRSVRDIFLTSSAAFADRNAFLEKRDGEWHAYSYRRFRSDAEALATELLSFLPVGGKVMILGANRYAWVLSFMATVSAGGVAVPFDREANADTVARAAARVGASAILYDDAFVSATAATGDDVKKIPFSSIPALLASGREKIAGGASAFSGVEVDPDALSVISFTSGSTGEGRGVMLSGDNICFDVDGALSLVDLYETDLLLSVLPLHHPFEGICTFLAAIRSGACVAFCEGLGSIIRDMNEVKPTVMNIVPSIASALYKKLTAELYSGGNENRIRAEIAATSLISPLPLAVAAKKKLFAKLHDGLGGRLRLLISGGAKLDAEVLRGLRGLGFPTIEGYGLAECGAVVSVNPVEATKPGSVGVGLPDATVDIYNVQEDGTGEIRVKGRNVMLGYFGDDAATAEAKRGDWFYTGDLGTVDEDGYLHITGRKKNVIVKADGKNVFPEELESLLCASRFVREAVVLGLLNDRKRDYDLVAVVCPDNDALTAAYGESFSASDVDVEIGAAILEVNRSLPDYKQINLFILRKSEFEKSPSHKILRNTVAPSVIDEYKKKISEE